MKAAPISQDQKKEKNKNKKQRHIGQTSIGELIFHVFSPNALSALYKTKGFVCVGGDSFLVVKQSRAPFLAVLLPMLLGFAACAVVLLLAFSLDGGDVGEYHPLPDIDKNIEVIDPQNPAVTTRPPTTTKPSSQTGSHGSVSMIYTKSASYAKGKTSVTVHFKNPSNSNHDAVLELFAVATDGSLVLMARSGRIPAGYGISEMTLESSAPYLDTGTYSGLYVVSFYDPTTGEKATVDTKIPDVVITVR